VAETYFDEWSARNYARLWPELFDQQLIGSTVDFLAQLCGGGSALEFGVGTGRIAVPLANRGIRVAGIELSQAMADELRRGSDAATAIDVAIGDIATRTVAGAFSLVYLLRNTITNLTTQEAQIAAFRNAAAHLAPGGCFLIENYVPHLRRLPPGETAHAFIATAEHVGVEEYSTSTQIAISRHWWLIDGEVKTFSSPHRYVWPSELDLMAKMAGMYLRERWADWYRKPFTEDSDSHVSVWQKPMGGA
jgi:SAM-dependent methyltransferase